MKTKYIKIQTEVPITLEKHRLIVHTRAALNQLLGSSAASSNLKMYGVSKNEDNNRYAVFLDTVIKRRDELDIKIKDLQDKVQFINSVLKYAENNNVKRGKK